MKLFNKNYKKINFEFIFIFEKKINLRKNKKPVIINLPKKQLYF